MNISLSSPSPRGRIVFRSAAAFYTGCLAITAGVLLHLPVFISARAMHYKLAGMGMDPAMIVGMALIIAGLLLAAYGVCPPPAANAGAAGSDAGYAIRTLDDAPLTTMHWQLIVVLGVALIIDIMKPATLGFVVPGMKAEYGLSKSTVAWLPFVALGGTVLGSFLWGYLGDRFGRRASVLLAAMLFIGTSICGAMPSFGWNVYMCFMMGLSAGGLLPITIALLSEILPVRHRAALIVLLSGIGAAGGYLAASGSATLLEPTFGWRIMWFLGLPTGLVLLLLNRYIPESPRFLLSRGRVQEANQILHDFGATLVSTEPVAGVAGARSAVRVNVTPLFRLPYLPQTVAVTLYGLSWGLVNYGFLLWLPTNLQSAGFGAQSANAILAKSALVAFPGALLVAWLYARWSSKRTMLLFSFLTALSLLAFLPLSSSGAHQHAVWLTFSLVALLVSSGAMTATLSPYSAEVYPTRLRGTGAGIAAGSGKLGGLVGQGAVLAKAAPALGASAFLVAAPVAVALLVLGFTGLETQGRRLEETAGDTFVHSPERLPVS